MSLLPFMTDIAVRACGQKLITPECMTDSEIEQVIERKPEILAELRTR